MDDAGVFGPCRVDGCHYRTTNPDAWEAHRQYAHFRSRELDADERSAIARTMQEWFDQALAWQSRYYGAKDDVQVQCAWDQMRERWENDPDR